MERKKKKERKERLQGIEGWKRERVGVSERVCREQHVSAH